MNTQEMPSNTRYTVAVEGQALTYWDNIHDAITNAQRAVYASVDATMRAIADLKNGQLAEWSYGFSAVRIYPPQREVEAQDDDDDPTGYYDPVEGCVMADPMFESAEVKARLVPLYPRATQPAEQPLTDEACTRIYNEANGITTKNPPITTERIFKAMRAAHGIGETK